MTKPGVSLRAIQTALLLGMVTLAVLVLAFGCGALAEDPVHACFNEEEHEPDVPVLPWGMVPEESLDPTVDKSFTASQGGLFPKHLAVQGGYGVRDSNGHCNADPADWNSPCEVVQYRKDVVYLDMGSCTGVSSILTGTLQNAYHDLEGVLRNEAGWNLQRTYNPSLATVKVMCDASLGVGGKGGRERQFCWDLPGQPYDVCFGSVAIGAGRARVGLQSIQAAYGTGLYAQQLTFNVVRHEILHALEWGHFNSDPDNLMNTDLPTDEILDLNPSQIEWKRNFLLAGHVGEPSYCNWQPGDPLGDICPNNVPAP